MEMIMQLNSKQDASANRLHDSRSSHDLAQSRHLPKARSGADENAVGALARAARGDSGCRVTVAIFENSGHVVGFSSTPLATSPSAARHLVTDVDESGELIVLLNVAAIDIDERRRKQAAGQPVGGPTGSATADQFAAGKAENMADLLSSPLFAGGELVGILA